MWTIFEYPYNSRQSYLLNSPDYFKYFADFNKESVLANLFLLCRYFRFMLKCTCYKLLGNKWCHRILGEKRFTEIHLRLLKGDLLISEINVTGSEFQILPEWDTRNETMRFKLPNLSLHRACISYSTLYFQLLILRLMECTAAKQEM